MNLLLLSEPPPPPQTSPRRVGTQWLQGSASALLVTPPVLIQVKRLRTSTSGVPEGVEGLRATVRPRVRASCHLKSAGSAPGGSPEAHNSNVLCVINVKAVNS